MKRGILILLLAKCLLVSGQDKYDLYIKMNSTSPVDMSQTPKSISASNVSGVTGKVDNALSSTTGGGARLQVTTSYGWDTTNGGTTVNFWINPTLGTAMQQILSTSAFTTKSCGLRIYTYTKTISVYYWKYKAGSLGDSTSVNINNILTTGWQMITISWTNGVGFSIYRNGVLFQTVSLTLPLNWIGVTSTVRPIMSTVAPASPLLGSLDEFWILNRPLSAQEIKTKYDNYIGIY